MDKGGGGQKILKFCGRYIWKPPKMSSVSTKEPKDSKMSKSEFFQEQLQLSSIALSSLCHFVVKFSVEEVLREKFREEAAVPNCAKFYKESHRRRRRCSNLTQSFS